MWSILIVDDSQAQMTMTEDLLVAVRDDVQCTGAMTYHEGLSLATTRSFDLILMDYDLGDVTGIGLIQELHQHGVDVPIILLTGHGNREVDLQAMESGAVDYLDKTDLKPSVLERAVRYAIRYDRTMRRLRQSEARLRQVMHHMPAGVFIRQNQRLVFCNTAMEDLTGYPLAVLLNYDVTDLVHPEWSVDFEFAFREFEDGQPVTLELQIQVREGQARWVQLSLSAIDYEEAIATFGAMIDITERKIAEAIEREQRTLAEALLDVSSVINSTLEFDEVLTRILENVGYVIPHDIAMIMLIEDNYTRVAGYLGPDYAELERVIRRTHQPIDGTPELMQMIHDRQPVRLSDIQPRGLWGHLREAFDLRSYLAVPVQIADQVIGFINLFSFQPDFFNPQHGQRLTIFADQASVAVRNAQVYEHAQKDAAEQERQRLARDLHDAVSQTLFSTSVIAESLPRLMGQDDDALVNGLQRLSQMTKGALAEMRTLLLELRPRKLIETEFSVLLTHLVNAARSHTDTQIVFQAPDDKILLPPDVKVGLYRIAQEALNNVIKHAQAHHAQVILHDDPAGIHLQINDDGCGFLLSTVAKDHMGLQIMHERAQKIDVTVEINSEAGQGTRIIAYYPKGDTGYV
jgi:PAS domain S-box-containing protein